MSLFNSFTFQTGGIPRGNHVSNQHMIRVVEDYIYQEKGERVNIVLHVLDPQGKSLLLKAYAWAKDHLK